MNLTKMYCYLDEITLSHADSGLSGREEYDISQEHQDAIQEVIQQIKNKPLEARMVPHNKYSREIKPNVWVDVYQVLGAFTGHYSERIKPMIDHLVKKLLAGGERGHKDLRQDLVDVRDTAQRAIETLDEWV